VDRFLTARVTDYMTREVVSVRPDVPLGELEALFARLDFNGVPVVDGGVLAGMVTKFDVLRAFLVTPPRVGPRFAEIQRLSAGQVMTREVITFPPDALLRRVLQTMIDFRIKSFPVLEAGRLVGMVAREDVARALRDAASVTA
jgi:CBS domain-containing protein